MMARLEILNPVAKVVEHSVKPAPRPATLDGTTIRLYWNMKAGGDAALDRTEQLLRQRYPLPRCALPGLDPVTRAPRRWR